MCNVGKSMDRSEMAKGYWAGLSWVGGGGGWSMTANEYRDF